MSIADKITSIEGHLTADYEGLENLGADLTNVNKNIQNIRTCLDNIYSSLPKTTGEGSNLSLTTLKGRINVDDILGDTEQDTTLGYNIAPVNTSSYTLGENDISITGGGNGATLFDNISLTANTTYYLKFVVLQKPTTSTTFSTYIDGAPADNIGFLNFNDSSVGVVLTKTYTPTSNVILKVREWGNSKNELIKFQYWITTDNTKNTYEPYTNGASPNPTYPQDINVVTGTQEVVVQTKNLAYIEAEGKYRSSASGNFSISANYNGYIAKVKPSTTYSGSFTNMASNYNDVSNLCYFDKNMNFISGNSYNTANKTFTTPSNCAYATMAVKTTITDFQVELGSTSTSYIEHQEQTKTLHLSSKNLFDGQLELGSIDASTGEKYASTTLYRSANFTKVEPETQYTLSINGVSQKYCLYYYNSSKAIISYDTSLTTGTFTTPANTEYIMFRCFQADFTDDFANLKVQLEKGSSATTYEPYYNYELAKIGTYQDRIFRTSGKNLFGDTLRSGVTNYQTGAYSSNATRLTSTNWTFLKAGTYTISAKNSASKILQISNITFDKDNNYYEVSGVSGQWKNLPFTITLPQDTNWKCNIEFSDASTIQTMQVSEVQLELGTTTTSYEPYGTNWYIEKNIGKANLENIPWTGAATASGYKLYATEQIRDIKYVSANTIVGEGLAYNYIMHTGNGMSHPSALNCIAIDTNAVRVQTTSQAPTGIFYYALATPTYTEITNETLQNELNELEKMMSYNGQTNISVSGNLPMILDVTALKGESE